MKKIGRNDPCDCGSGKKFKQCCQPRLEAGAVKEMSDAKEISNIFRVSLAHHQANRWEQAEAGYLTVLQMAPHHVDALHLLGVVSRQNGNPERAIELIEQALSIKPDYAEACNNLGIALKETGQLDAAIRSYRRALKLKPDLVDAHYNLGIAFKEQGELDAAISSYQKAIQFRPGYAEAHNNLGIVFKQRGQLSEAIVCHEEAIRLKPDYAEAHNNLGVAFKAQGRYEMAVASYQRAIALKPDFFEAYNNLGNALQELGRMDEALGVYVTALGYEPNSYEAHNNLGAVFQDQGEFDRAFACYQRSLALNPDYAEAHNNLGNVLRRQGKIEEAVASYRTAISLKPDYVAVLSNLGNALKELGDVDAAMATSHNAWALDPEGFSGLASAVRLAVLCFLKGDVSKANETLALSQYILTAQEEKFAAPKEYWMLLHKLVQDGQATAVGDNEQQVGETLYVVGESHMLSVHNRSFVHDGSRVRCQGQWIEGCKQWHLANGEENAYKYQLRRILNSIPRQAKIMLMIGEIDCRVNEGILPAWKKSNGKRIEDITSSTAIGYLNYVSNIAAERDQKLIICGVPAPNIRLDLLTQEDSEQFLSLVAGFNSVLREHSVGHGWGFLDLFAMTNCGAGCSDGRWHLDHHHLRPDAYVEAFGKYLIGMTLKPSSSMQSETITIEDALQRAVAHHQAGQLQDAERLYGAILQVQPNHADANHNLGVLAVQLKQSATALPYFKAALEANPNQGQYWLSYIDALIQTGQTDIARQLLAQGRQRGLQGDAVETLALILGQVAEGSPDQQEVQILTALFSEGRYADAATLAQSVIERFPLHSFGWKILGAAFKQMGRNADALAAMQKAVVLSPVDAAVHNNLGVVLQEQNRFDEAEASYRRALEINPAYAEAYNNLGNVMQDLGRLDDAVVNYHKAIEAKPNYTEAHNNMGVALRALGQIERAAASYLRALEIKPDYTEAHINLGVALHNMARFADAAESYRRALEINPAYAEAHSNLAAALRELGQLDKAVASCCRALEIKPDYAEAHSNLGNILRELGQLDKAVASYRRALEIDPGYAEAHSNLLFILNYLADQPAATLLAEAKRFGELAARQARPCSEWSNVPDSSRCLRVGLVSGDLRNHPVGYFVEGVLAALASDASGRLEFIAYPSHFLSDALTERVKACCHGWYSAVGLSDGELARRIREDGIDILIDLSGHTAHNRQTLFAWKPAPVQVSWLGYFATTGIAAVDYLIADPWTLPEAEEVNFTEKIWRLPETRLCFTPPDTCVDVVPLPALSNGYITFGCFNNLTKMNDDVVALWARVLAAVPGSCLFLKAKQLKEVSVRQSIVERFASKGINADRLILEEFGPRAEYLAAYQRVDIALDPFPFPGGTTSVESLWMGVPVLTLAGERFLSRQGVGILMNAALPEWIAADKDDYVVRAVMHAGDLQRLSSLRSSLRQRVLASPLFDAPRFARNFEVALRGMWQKWCDGQASGMKTFLHVGCGPNYKKHTTQGFNTHEWKELRFDIDESVVPDIVGTMLDMSAVQNESIDAVFSSHNIEHLYPHEVPLALKEFIRVLKPEGFLVITCPDIQSVSALVAEDKLDEPAYNSPAGPIAPIDILYGHRPAIAKGNLFMAHRCGFTQKVLIDTLERAGFSRVACMRRGHPYYDLYALATKATMEENEIRALAAQHFPG